MSTKKITYDNKVGVIPKTIRINQVWDDDMNHIKDVVNTNADQLAQNTNDIGNIIANPVSAANVSAVAHLEYLLGTNVQLQLDQAETAFINTVKTNKRDDKNMYQTGINRVDLDTSVVSAANTDGVVVTNVNNIMFVNEIAVDVNGNREADYIKSFGSVLFEADDINTPLAANTRGIFYAGVDKTGTQVYRTSKVYDQDVCYLIRMVVANTAGVYSVVSFKYMPDLAQNKFNNRDRFVQASGSIVPSGAASISFGNRAISYTKNSINYANNKLDPNYLSIPNSVNPTPMQFLLMKPNVTSLAVNIVPQTVFDPKLWYTAAGATGGTNIGPNNYQVYKLWLSVTGTLIIQVKASTSNAPQLGVNAIFATRDEAVAGLGSVVFPPILPEGDAIGLGTFYMRSGTAANGSDMNDSNNFQFSGYIASSSSSIVGVTTHDLLSGKNDNPNFQHATTIQIGEWNVAYNERHQWDGGSTNLNPAIGRTSLGGTTIGQNIFTHANPNAVTFARANADNTVDWLDAAAFRTAIGAGQGTAGGGGAANYIAKWTDTNILGLSQIFDNGTNVGIGTITPASKLTVAADIDNTGVEIVMPSGATGYPDGLLVRMNGTTYPGPDFGIPSAVTVLGNSNNSAGFLMRFDTGTGNSAFRYIKRAEVNGNFAYNVTLQGTNTSLFNVTDIGDGYFAGNVGIGTNPLFKLSIINPVNSTGLFIQNSGVGSVNDYSQISFGNVGSGNTIFTAIRSSFDNPAGNANNTMSFHTYGNAGLTEKMRISANGYVGIGTPAPEVNLDVAGVGGVTVKIGSVTSGDAVLRLENGGLGNWYQIYHRDTNAYAIQHNGAERFRINDVGNVGIGVSPQAKLHVAGNGIFETQLRTSQPLPATTTLDAADCSSIVATYTSVDQSDTKFYPMITGYNVITGVGYVNMPSFGWMRPTGGDFGGICSTAVIQISGDGTPIQRWLFRGDGSFFTPTNIIAGANITAGGTVTAASDIRLKTNIKPLKNSLSKVLKTQGSIFDRIDTGDKNQIGFVADDLLKVFPELVNVPDNKDEYKTVNYMGMTAILVEAIKEQQKEINELKKQLNLN